jgi:hypothetical protein
MHNPLASALRDSLKFTSGNSQIQASVLPPSPYSNPPAQPDLRHRRTLGHQANNDPTKVDDPSTAGVISIECLFQLHIWDWKCKQLKPRRSGIEVSKLGGKGVLSTQQVSRSNEGGVNGRKSITCRSNDVVGGEIA